MRWKKHHQPQTAGLLPIMTSEDTQSTSQAEAAAQEKIAAKTVA